MNSEKRVRIFVELDVVIDDPDWVLDDVLQNSPNYFASMMQEADAREAGHSPTYSLDTEDLTVWDPAGLIDALVHINGMTKDEKRAISALNRLTPSERLALRMVQD